MARADAKQNKALFESSGQPDPTGGCGTLMIE